MDAPFAKASLALVAFLLAAPSARGQEASLPVWDDYPVREVERPPLPATGGVMSLLSVTSLSSPAAFDRDGRQGSIDHTYNLFTTVLRLDYGVTDEWEVSICLPYQTGEIGGISGGAFRDPRVGTRLSAQLGPGYFLTFGVQASAPIADNDYYFAPSDDGANVHGLRAGDPGFSFYPEIESRLNLEASSLRLWARGIFTTPGQINFKFEDDPIKEAEADLGDGWQVNLGAYFQLNDNWAAGLFVDYISIDQTTIDGHGLDDDLVTLTVQPRVVFQYSLELEAELEAGWIAAGRNSPAGFPLTLRIRSRF